ncbi:MarR family winged helix-turn-helix transcriptional regulator [Amycolatopsis sp. 195334CR]|uniref:MarR family winged helix-turn-helix transcriptional regulator n=1 Tax=Amycolatopsis sp. 195334CR TaxID=2814588 RepID=UPI001A906F1F|nr:MarR family winged helix-turn-helix transcriptional regulator [Amycolatopsis sp. 195334CR]MBN6039867.1 winged helix-turn-helix transcriptional regulator [Amycolatopsis sp. 195334CR]
MLTSATAAELVDALRAVIRSGRAVQHHAYLREDLPPGAIALLALLRREGEQRLGRIAEHLDVDPSVISRQVAPLERAGLVRRRPDPGDGRAGLLAVTEDGDRYLCAHQERWAEVVATALTDWAEEDAEALIAGLHRLTHDIRAVRDLAALADS